MFFASHFLPDSFQDYINCTNCPHSPPLPLLFCTEWSSEVPEVAQPKCKQLAVTPLASGIQGGSSYLCGEWLILQKRKLCGGEPSPKAQVMGVREPGLTRLSPCGHAAEGHLLGWSK